MNKTSLSKVRTIVVCILCTLISLVLAQRAKADAAPPPDPTVGGDLSRFLMEIEPQDSITYADLRVDSMPRSFRVLLDEPLDADGSNSQTQMKGLMGANGSNMVDANGTALNSLGSPVINGKSRKDVLPSE